MNAQSILNCHHKDQSGLNDYHKQSNGVGTAIDRVGINRFRIPLQFRYQDGATRSHDTEASIFVRCPEHLSAINMSRLCQILTAESEAAAMDSTLFKQVLTRLRSDMRDSDEEAWMPEAVLNLRFKYALKQPSLKSKKWGWQYYDCDWEGIQDAKGKVRFFLTLKYEYSSTCPCSLSMAKQYEKDYVAGKTEEGHGIAVAHSQRSVAECRIEFDSSKSFYIEELVQLLRRALPTETQSLVKRVDEQAFAILNGSNPMFVENAARNLNRELNSDARILDWVAQVEHLESLHSHNAVAVISKGKGA